MATSETINELVGALVKAQGELKNAPMNRENPHFKSKYADLASIRDAVFPALSKHGLTVMQTTVPTEAGLILETRLAHTSGQWVLSQYPLPLVVDKPQQLGSALTYARRYSLASIVGIAAEEDDDANIAQNAGSRKVATKGPPLMTGKHGITKLKELAREMYSDLEACEDEDQLVAFLNTTGFQEWAEQVQRDQPHWWYGRGDETGFEERIEQKRAEIGERQANGGGMPPDYEPDDMDPAGREA